jgi:mannobiose 2-epimerase
LYKHRAVDIINLICGRMLHPEYGTGIAQFGANFTPKRAIIFKNVWGSDRNVDNPEGRPLDNTSYGHNVEFAWLLSHSIDILALDRSAYVKTIRKLYDHCLNYGIDWERGGVYCEGPHNGEAREKNKEFWQQAETLVAMLDATAIFDDDKYWRAYKNVHRFVFDYMINHRVGEWFPLFNKDNELIWDYMGHAWKINYHTARSMLECERRLSELSHLP